MQVHAFICKACLTDKTGEYYLFKSGILKGKFLHKKQRVYIAKTVKTPVFHAFPLQTVQVDSTKVPSRSSLEGFTEKPDIMIPVILYIYIHTDIYIYWIGKFLSPLGFEPRNPHKPSPTFYHLSQASRVIPVICL